MTNEEAIAWLEHHFDPLPDGTKQSEAVSLAIKALEQETKYCDRNICISNEYNGIGCDECEVTKSQKAGK